MSNTSPPTPINTNVTTSHIHLYTQPLQLPLTYVMGWDSIVGIATHYQLDGPGIESSWGQNILHLSRPALGPTQPPIQWVSGHSQG